MTPASMRFNPHQPTAIDGYSDVVVCIPTFRRAGQLARLLRALAAQEGVPAFDILIGNNEERTLASYAELCDPTLPGYRTIQVLTRGVSAVRNAMIAEVLARDAPVKWIACLDDDQQPARDWLAALLEAGAHYDADLVGGPVSRTASLATFWARGAADTSYLQMEAGPTPMLNEAGNLLVSVTFLRTLERPPFSLDFGRTGGEDYEFFLLARSKGARIVWAPGAQVSEPLPPDRLTFRSFVWRFYAIAAYQARADRTYCGTLYVLRSIAYTCIKGPVVLLRSLVRDRSFRIAVGVIVQYFSIVAGRIVGLIGGHAERYGR